MRIGKLATYVVWAAAALGMSHPAAAEVTPNLKDAFIQAGAIPQADAPQQSPVRIVEPKNGTALNHDFVTLKLDLVRNPSSENPPTFEVQLDDQDRIYTTSTQQDFNGLSPGRHTIFVQIVDANCTPIAGTHAEVSFTVTNPSPTPPPTPASPPGLRKAVAGLLWVAAHPKAAPAQDEPPASTDKSQAALPQTGGPLPLITAVGFGALIGGLFSARRTRNR